MFTDEHKGGAETQSGSEKVTLGKKKCWGGAMESVSEMPHFVLEGLEQDVGLDGRRSSKISRRFPSARDSLTGYTSEQAVFIRRELEGWPLDVFT